MALIAEHPLPQDFVEHEEPAVNEEHAATRSLPFMAVAIVAHGVLLLAAALVTFVLEIPPVLEPIVAEKTTVVVPPMVDPETTPPKELPEDVPETDKPTMVTEIVENAVDSTNETLSENPLVSEVMSDSPDNAESPNPNTGPSSALGLGGAAGGGGGGPPGGGLDHRGVSGPPGRTPVPPVRVDAGLQWLADHQNPKGYWSPTEYLDDSIRLRNNPRGKPATVTHNVDFRDNAAVGGSDIGFESAQVGLTGLALLAFLGDGHTQTVGRYKPTVRSALSWLKASQDAEGCFGARDDEEFVYNHAICAMAFAEAYAMTNQMFLKIPAQKAVDFIVAAQNPGQGWRYGIQPRDNDSSVTAWMVLALKSAKIAGLKFPEEEVYAGANTWFDRATGQNDFGYEVTGYNATAVGNARLAQCKNFEQNPSMDACSVMVRLFTGHKSIGDRKIQQQASMMVQTLPTWYTNEDETKGPYKIDYYYWYYASLALYQVGGSQWEQWQNSLFSPVLLRYQRGWHSKDLRQFEEYGNMITKGGTNTPDEGRWLLDEHGSWDPVGPWGPAGGRVYSTAINVLTLEVFYRYKRIADEKSTPTMTK